LLPPEVFAAKPATNINWQVPCVQIEDQPRFKWRGLLLDVARHFFTKQEVKQLLDEMAMQKINTLQMHLTDDQGWRIEIKKYPRLTEIGAWRKDAGFGLDPKASMTYGPDGRYGGYYTQDDIREIVAYARGRHITVVPEIEMPGHASAALSAFPELSCNGGPYTPNAQGGVFAGVYCAGKDETFEFLQNVLVEVRQLFPCAYIHIGGDEVRKDNWKKCPRCQARIKQEGLKSEHELQSYFIRRIEKSINAQGRTLIGWSEIREGGLAQNAVVMDWIGGAVEAASAGHDVIMSPTGYCYLDYYQSTNHVTEPKAIGGYLPLSKVYAFEPLPAKLDPQYRSHILGAQGNLWTEYIPNFKQAQYMVFPRLSALAEVTWSAQAARNWEDFTRRLQTQFQRFDQLGVNCRKGTPERISE
jgi:hexosaminidase